VDRSHHDIPRVDHERDLDGAYDQEKKNEDAKDRLDECRAILIAADR